jgi:hypothetical protein
MSKSKLEKTLHAIDVALNMTLVAILLGGFGMIFFVLLKVLP